MFRPSDEGPASFPETLPNAWNNLGLLATQEGRTDEAIPFFEQALKVSPNNLIALDNLASAYRQQKRWDEARRVLDRALSVSPDRCLKRTTASAWCMRKPTIMNGRMSVCKKRCRRVRIIRKP